MTDDAKQPSVNVVVELNSDGFVRVFGPKNVNVTFVSRPSVSSQESDRILDRLIDECLPIRFAEVFNPSYIRGVGMVEKRTVENVISIVQNLSLDDSLRKIGNPDFYTRPGRSLVAAALGITR